MSVMVPVSAQPIPELRLEDSDSDSIMGNSNSSHTHPSPLTSILTQLSEITNIPTRATLLQKHIQTTPAAVITSSQPLATTILDVTNQHMGIAVAEISAVVPQATPLENEEKKETIQQPVSQEHYWAKGTGYGHDCSAQAEWDHETYFAMQSTKEQQIINVCRNILAQVKLNSVDMDTLLYSCLIPFLEYYLSNDSITDMEQHHAQLYCVIFEMCAEISRHPSLVKLFVLLPGQTRSIQSYILDLQKQAHIAEKVATPTSTPVSTPESTPPTTPTSSTSSISESPTIELIPQIVSLSNAITVALSCDDEMITSTPSTTHSDQVDLSQYVDRMKPHQFGEIEEFTAHHYWNEYSTTEAISRAWTRRLAMEYSDLSKSLPLTPDSSVFLRYHESKMGFAQILIIAPDETPYGRGAFLFDVYFPTTYPDTPPLVNLQTTGHGSVRFNPNLYNCGKVCLSLLGTWSGSQGESWLSKTSTFLQVAVSIQSLIFVPQPYFNEPGCEVDMGTEQGKQYSDDYNAVIYPATIRYAMIEMMKNPPVGFEEIIRIHFTLQKENILKQCKLWAETNEECQGLIQELEDQLNKQTLTTKQQDED